MLYGQVEKLSLKEFINQKPILIWITIILLTVSGFSTAGFGVFQLVNTNDQEIVSSNDVENQVCQQSDDFGQISVYISGAVVSPGVYILESNDRIVDVLNSAGGISKHADKLYVNKQLNLAHKLSDGDQLYIPTVNEVVTQLETENAETLKQPISINSSTKAQLMELSGIGDARAQQIIENRPYASLNELVEKKVISQSLFNDIEKQIQL